MKLDDIFILPSENFSVEKTWQNLHGGAGRYLYSPMHNEKPTSYGGGISSIKHEWLRKCAISACWDAFGHGYK